MIATVNMELVEPHKDASYFADYFQFLFSQIRAVENVFAHFDFEFVYSSATMCMEHCVYSGYPFSFFIAHFFFILFFSSSFN